PGRPRHPGIRPQGRAGPRRARAGEGSAPVIAFLTGRVAGRGGGSAVIDVGGVGMTVLCTPATLARLRVGETATVATSLVVREDSLTLYGFADADERDVFERLQTASGVGPRLALAMLAVHTPEALRKAVAAEDTAALTAVPGIGRKGAQRIVLELRDKLGEPVGAADGPAPALPRAAACPATPQGTHRGQPARRPTARQPCPHRAPRRRTDSCRRRSP